jgi:hypothetical protein
MGNDTGRNADAMCNDAGQYRGGKPSASWVLVPLAVTLA